MGCCELTLHEAPIRKKSFSFIYIPIMATSTKFLSSSPAKGYGDTPLQDQVKRTVATRTSKANHWRLMFPSCLEGVSTHSDGACMLMPEKPEKQVLLSWPLRFGQLFAWTSLKQFQILKSQSSVIEPKPPSHVVSFGFDVRGSGISDGPRPGAGRSLDVQLRGHQPPSWIHFALVHSSFVPKGCFHKLGVPCCGCPYTTICESILGP